jgi:hypothetical protein
MGLIEHAKTELDYIGMTENSPDEMNVMMRKHLLHMVEEFAKEGHSGFSSSYAINALTKLFRYEPLSPLTGDDDEWEEVGTRYGGEPLYQNKRCSRIFKDDSGTYDIDGKVFIDKHGAFTNKDSRVYITFPYTPTTEYVYLEETDNEVS